jgi:hypothetical protein
VIAGPSGRDLDDGWHDDADLPTCVGTDPCSLTALLGRAPSVGIGWSVCPSPGSSIRLHELAGQAR